MTTLNYTYSDVLVYVTCGDCGIPHGLPQDLQAARAADGKFWYCPNGHCIHYFESEAARLTRQLAYANDQKARLAAERDQAEASRRAWKGQTTRLRKRLLDGECPICGQHLRDVARHVARQHPTEAAEMPEPIE